MVTFFDEASAVSAKKVFEEIGDWIWQAGFQHLMKWYSNLEKGWDTLKNYFVYRVTSALSEGINNVIKTLKRRAIGYKNMWDVKTGKGRRGGRESRWPGGGGAGPKERCGGQASRWWMARWCLTCLRVTRRWSVRRSNRD